MDLQLKGKTALVTGSTAGIGKAIAAALAREGATVLINGRHPDKVNAVIQEIGAQYPGSMLKPAAADLGTEQGCQDIIGQFPEIEILVNNLGIFEPADFFEIRDEDWFRFFEVNIMSGVRLSRHYLNGMIGRGEGRIIFVASESAIVPAPEMAHYSATKTMQLAVSRSLAELAKGTNVTVNAVLPGSTLTEGVEQMLETLYPEGNLSVAEAERKFMKENRPTSIIQRLIRPEEIADFTVFVCSPLASAVNGAALRVDGGLVRSVI